MTIRTPGNQSIRLDDAADVAAALARASDDPSLSDAAGWYTFLYELCNCAADLLAECEKARDEANERIEELEQEQE